MNKLAQASVAGAAGIALLLGGAGTFALWNAQAEVADTSIASGSLSIEAGDVSAAFADGTPFTSGTRIVPGDTITITQDVTIDANGDTLLVKLGVDTGSIPNIPGVNLAVSALTADGVFGGDLNRMTAAEAETIESVVITGTFPASLTGSDGQNMTINLTGMAVTLTQVIA